ncbi:MAG: peptidoglycan DD-metalloendopeptidase family protein, partial [Saprospiraceae bacterium]|nr:peptidoglycan DD-metalloendopeptidase family protein [Saprospiraceae bacterium]
MANFKEIRNLASRNQKPPVLDTQHPKRKIRRIYYPAFAMAALATFFFVDRKTDIPLEDLSDLKVPALNVDYGINLNNYDVDRGMIEPNQFLADILLQYKVNYQEISDLAEAATDIFDVRNLRSNKPYAVLSSDTSQSADYFIYEPNVLSYVIYSIKDKKVELVDRDVSRRQQVANGMIESSLWQTMIDQNLDYELAAKMEDALAWSVDFHHIQKGDGFKVFYEELFIGDKSVGIGELYGAYFNNSNNDYYAIKFHSDKYEGFYDLQGRPMKKVFLKAPVKYTRISSKYNLRRFHPVLKRVKAHLGTDYAAPYGTPIYAVANGLVAKRGYTKGNGNYVKIKHDNVYSTQYLHMQRFGKGIKRGMQVQQGQVIGYVGSTGLANGPHVCFR